MGAAPELPSGQQEGAGTRKGALAPMDEEVDRRGVRRRGPSPPACRRGGVRRQPSPSGEGLASWVEQAGCPARRDGVAVGLPGGRLAPPVGGWTWRLPRRQGDGSRLGRWLVPVASEG